MLLGSVEALTDDVPLMSQDSTNQEAHEKVPPTSGDALNHWTVFNEGGESGRNVEYSSRLPADI